MVNEWLDSQDDSRRESEVGNECKETAALPAT